MMKIATSLPFIFSGMLVGSVLTAGFLELNPNEPGQLPYNLNHSNDSSDYQKATLHLNDSLTSKLEKISEQLDEQQQQNILLIERVVALIQKANSGTTSYTDASPTLKTVSREELEPRQEIALQNANQLVDVAISAGFWGEEEKKQLFNYFKDIPSNDRVEMLRRLVIATNEGSLDIEAHGLSLHIP